MHLALLALAAVAAGPGSASLQWSDLPPLPDALGFGGPFVGVAGDALVVAGGANFPGAPPWEDGAKVWHDRIFVLAPAALDAGASAPATDAVAWVEAGVLPAPRAYGGSVATDDGLLLLGGSDADGARAEVWHLTLDDALAPTIEAWPSLPEPSAFGAAARVGDLVLVAGGQRSNDPTDLAHALWALDLAAPPEARAWERLPAWPGAARTKTAAAVQADGFGTRHFYLMGGEVDHAEPDGSVRRTFPLDAYRFDVAARRWARIADLPHPAAASAAIGVGQAHVLVFSGDRGANASVPLADRPEFEPGILAYHTVTDAWTALAADAMPQAVVTAGITAWRDRVVIASGEIRPGVRTRRVQAFTIGARPSHFGAVNWTVLGAYLGGIVALGAWFARRERTSRDFFLAGGRIPWWAAGLSIFATQLSAITFMAAPAVAFSTDWLTLPGKLMILAMAPLVVWCFLPVFRSLDLTSAYEYLERRFSLPVRLYGSASFVAFQLVRMAIVVYLPALALEAITGLDVYACIAIVGVLAIAYTVLGGMEAVVWTDVAQAVVLMGGVGAAFLLVVADEGGIGPLLSEAREHAKLRTFHWTWDHTVLATWSIVLGEFFLQFQPYTADQAVVQRYLATPDDRAARRGVWLNAVLAFPVNLLFLSLGAALFVFFRHRPELLPIGMPNDQVFPLFMAERMPAGLAGLVVAGVFAASMSSLDSSMHSVATAATTDFFRRFRPDAPDARVLRIARVLIVLVGLVAIVVAAALVTYDITSLFFFFQKALGLLGSGLAGIFILGVLTRRATATGALAGALASVAALAYVTWSTPMHFYLYAVVGITTCVVVGYAVSVLGPRAAPA